MISCRHAVVYRALNLHQGETYRHVLYIQEQVCNKKKDDTPTFFCYDVVCQYWKFLISVAEKIERFKPLVEKMKPFLSRWHGQTHAWYCQVTNMFLKIIILILFVYFYCNIFFYSFYIWDLWCKGQQPLPERCKSRLTLIFPALAAQQSIWGKHVSFAVPLCYIFNVVT